MLWIKPRLEEPVTFKVPRLRIAPLFERESTEITDDELFVRVLFSATEIFC